jgi:hypothetical protein
MRLIPTATDAINLQVISWDNDTRSQFKFLYSLLYLFVMLSLIIVQANNITLFERPRQPFSAASIQNLRCQRIFDKRLLEGFLQNTLVAITLEK